MSKRNIQMTLKEFTEMINEKYVEMLIDGECWFNSRSVQIQMPSGKTLILSKEDVVEVFLQSQSKAMQEFQSIMVHGATGSDPVGILAKGIKSKQGKPPGMPSTKLVNAIDEAMGFKPGLHRASDVVESGTVIGNAVATLINPEKP
jgi:hypothetical protein